MSEPAIAPLRDRNGKSIQPCASVSVPAPDPTKGDIHQHEFIGTGADFREASGLVVVEDQDSDFFEIESNRLTVVS